MFRRRRQWSGDVLAGTMLLIHVGFKLADLTLTPTPQLLLLNKTLFMIISTSGSTHTFNSQVSVVQHVIFN